MSSLHRRQFLKAGALAGAAMMTAGIVAAEEPEKKVDWVTDISDPLKQPPLPYALDALDPFLTGEQMNYHYNKHHASYYANLKKLLEGKPETTLPEIIKTAEPGALFNNAAQAWNHAFFWNCMTPPGEAKKPSEKLVKAIDRDFGSLDKFKEDFAAKAVGVFGSGWCWLTKDTRNDGKLEIMQASNADCPLKYGKTPILVVDVWEHAYYVDYRNDRAKFVKAFLEHVNWDFVSHEHSRVILKFNPMLMKITKPAEMPTGAWD